MGGGTKMVRRDLATAGQVTEKDRTDMTISSVHEGVTSKKIDSKN